MFANLIKILCQFRNVPVYNLGKKLGYKTPSAFQTVTTGRDIRLTVLLKICDALGYTVTISNGDDFTLNLNEYIKQQTDDENGDE